MFGRLKKLVLHKHNTTLAMDVESTKKQHSPTGFSDYITIKCENDLKQIYNGCLVEISGSFRTTETGYEMQILYTSEKPELTNFTDPNIKVCYRNPFSDILIEVLPLPTSDSRTWKRECSRYWSLYSMSTSTKRTELKEPIPSLYGVINRVNDKHYRLLGAFRSAVSPSNELFKNVCELVNDYRYILPDSNDMKTRQIVSGICRPDADDYGLSHKNPLLLDNAEDVWYLLKNLRDKDGASFNCSRSPDSLICDYMPGVGIIAVLEYVLRNSLSGSSTSIFVCRHGISTSPKNPIFKVPYGLVLNREEEFSEEKLIDVCTDIVSQTLMEKYSARRADSGIEIYVPTSNGGLYVHCSVRDEVQKFLIKKMEWNPKIKSSAPTTVGKTYKSEIIINIYRTHAKIIRWLIDPKLRIEIEHMDDIQYIHEESKKEGISIDDMIDSMNFVIDDVFQKNWVALIKNNAFAVLETMDADIISSHIFCHKCGTRIPSDSMFCTKCGAKVIQLP